MARKGCLECETCVNCESTAYSWIRYMILATAIPSAILWISLLEQDPSVMEILRELIIPSAGIITIAIESAVCADYLYPAAGERLHLTENEAVNYVFGPAILAVAMYIFGTLLYSIEFVFFQLNFTPLFIIVCYLTSFIVTFKSAKMLKSIDYSGINRPSTQTKESS